MRRTLLATVSSLVLGASLSGTALATEGSVTSKIIRMYYYEGHAGLLIMLGTMSDLGGCGASTWYILPDTQTHYKEVVALLMSAEAQDKQVNITIGDCFQGYGRIKHAMLVE